MKITMPKPSELFRPKNRGVMREHFRNRGDLATIDDVLEFLRDASKLGDEIAAEYWPGQWGTVIRNLQIDAEKCIEIIERTLPEQ